VLPKFLYFDLGNVLLEFTVQRMLRQVSEATGVDPERVREILFHDELQQQYELGQISDREFFEAFCRQTDTRPEFEALKLAASDIFELNLSMLPVVAHLQQAGYRLGILSNTCASHWEHCRRRYRILAKGFDVYALSFQIGAAKPDAAIFHAAADLAACRPQELFFVDDTPGHVAGARAAGLDSVHYTCTPQLVSELRSRGVQFNY
jgi:putative hydrolase of the HAD superfamily